MPWKLKQTSMQTVHYKSHLFKTTENCTTKNENFQVKNSDIFLISAQNILQVLVRTALMRRF